MPAAICRRSRRGNRCMGMGTTILPPPPIRKRCGAARSRSCSTPRSRLSAVGQHAVRHLRPGQNWRYLSTRHLPKHFSRMGVHEGSTLLKRLRWDQPSYTITPRLQTTQLRDRSFIRASPGQLRFGKRRASRGFPIRCSSAGEEPRYGSKLPMRCPLLSPQHWRSTCCR